MIISAARLLDWRNHHQKVNWHRPLLLWCPRSSSTAGTAIGALGQFTGGMWGTLGNRNPPSWHGKGQWQIQKVQRIWDLPLCNAQLLLKYNKVIDTASYKKDLWAASDSVTQLTCSWYWGHRFLVHLLPTLEPMPDRIWPKQDGEIEFIGRHRAVEERQEEDCVNIMRKASTTKNCRSTGNLPFSYVALKCPQHWPLRKRWQASDTLIPLKRHPERKWLQPVILTAPFLVKQWTGRVVVANLSVPWQERSLVAHKPSSVLPLELEFLQCETISANRPRTQNIRSPWRFWPVKWQEKTSEIGVISPSGLSNEPRTLIDSSIVEQHTPTIWVSPQKKEKSKIALFINYDQFIIMFHLQIAIHCGLQMVVFGAALAKFAPSPPHAPRNAIAKTTASGAWQHHRNDPRLWLKKGSGYLCHSHGKSPFLIGKPSISLGHFPWLC